MSLIERCLALADEPERGGQAAQVRAFQIFLLVHVAVRTWFWGLRADDDPWLRALLVGGLTACALAGFAARWARPAALAAAALLAVKLVQTFPATSNHFFLELCCVALLAFCDLDAADERALLLEAARWLTVMVLFYSGLQKVLHGTYFDAQFLGYSIATRHTFANAFAWLVPAGEIARLQGLRPIGAGSGPFAVGAPLAVAAANLVWVFELLAPVLLLWRRTRAWAAAAAIAFTIALQMGAREIMFGVLFVNLLLLFFVRPLNRALLPAVFALYALLLASRLRLLPALVFN